jgi:hypothetical protein
LEPEIYMAIGGAGGGAGDDTGDDVGVGAVLTPGITPLVLPTALPLVVTKVSSWRAVDDVGLSGEGRGLILTLKAGIEPGQHLPHYTAS